MAACIVRLYTCKLECKVTNLFCICFALDIIFDLNSKTSLLDWVPIFIVVVVVLYSVHTS